MPTYIRPGPDHEVHAIVARVIEDQFPIIHRLSPALQLGILFALPVKEGKSALKHRGWPCLGIIKIVGKQDRAAGEPDVPMILDGVRWPRLTPRRREALVAHELEHLEFPKVLKEVAEDETVRWLPMQDDLGRPKVKCRPHDFELGGFESIVERYGDDAPEKVVFEGIQERLSQLSFLEEVNQEAVADHVADLDREASGDAASEPRVTTVSFSGEQIDRLLRDAMPRIRREAAGI
jgi:Putative phage metallopeptidase